MARVDLESFGKNENKNEKSELTRRDFTIAGASALAAVSWPGAAFAAKAGGALPMSISEAGKRMRDGSLSCVDLTKAYWLIAGISGVDPDDASIGSAAWAEWVIDGDLGHEIDGREIPADWKTGMIPLRKAKPYELPRAADEGEVYHLLPSLVDWAYRLTRDVKLEDN